MTSQIITISDNALQNIPQDSTWVQALERGKVIFLPNLGFQIQDSERQLLNPDLLAPKSRNISLDAQHELKGATTNEEQEHDLKQMILRFKTYSGQVLQHLFPMYNGHLRWAPTSFRPARVESRVQSWRADDKRLHVDAFPSRPNRGERILRVFANINPHGESRVWRVGEPFEKVAQQFLPRCKPYRSWQAALLERLHITKSFRTEYDHLMLQLHDGMKADLKYQTTARQEQVAFPHGSIWICYSDQTSHAAMSGQFMMEQTLHLSVNDTFEPEQSPLNVLSKLMKKELV